MSIRHNHSTFFTYIKLNFYDFHLHGNLCQTNLIISPVSRMKNNIVGMETNMEQLLEKVFGTDSFWLLSNDISEFQSEGIRKRTTPAESQICC